MFSAVTRQSAGLCYSDWAYTGEAVARMLFRRLLPVALRGLHSEGVAATHRGGTKNKDTNWNEA